MTMCNHRWIDDWIDSGHIHQHCELGCGNFRYTPVPPVSEEPG